MSTPGKLALALYRGDTNRWRFVLWQDKEKTIPVDLTGVTVLAEIRNYAGGAVITEADILVSLPNMIDMTIDMPDSRSVVQRGVWDLQLTMADGAIHTLLAGPVTTTQDVVGSTP